MQYFDLVVIGGGLVGASFARAISGSNMRILIIDHVPAASAYAAELDNRGLALAYSSKHVLQELGCWQDLAATAYPILNVHVSEQNSFGFTKLCASSNKLPALGYVVSAQDLGKTLVAGLEQLPDITVMRPAVITAQSFDSTARCWNLTIAAEKVQAKFLVVADGGNLQRNAEFGIATHSVTSEQTAIVTNLYTTMSAVTTAYERFTALGVLALLPFGKNRIKCVWTVANANLEELSTCDDADFIKMVQMAIGFRAGKFTSMDARKYFPIRQAYATKLHTNNAVLLGNAANTLHPVAAQGFNLGLRDAVTLAQVLRQARQSGTELNEGVLQHYAKLRQHDQQRTRDFSNSLVTIFASSSPYIKISRRIGLLASQFIPHLNKKIISRGLGAWT